MTPEQAAYIAGIIDGEGSISLIKFHNNQHPSPLISIASVDIELLEWIRFTTGYGTIINKKNYKPEKHQNSYALNIKYNEALSLLKEITPYLVIIRKKQRALQLITGYKNVTPRNGRYSKDLLKQKEEFYKKFMQI